MFRVRAGVLFTLIGLLCWASPAAASTAQVEEARRLIDDLELDAALKVLDAAEKIEGNDRATVLEILTLQGIAFGTLNKEAKTRDSFRKLLMLAPDARLPSDVPPRVSTPFFEAKDWAATNGPLTLTGGVNLGGGLVKAVKVLVEKDALRMARSVRFHLEVDGRKETIEAPLVASRAEVPVGKRGVSWRAELLNERKGVLLEVPLRHDGEISPVAAVAEQPVGMETRGPLSGGWRRPTGFGLLGAGAVAAGVGIILGAQSAGARGKITNATRDDQGRVTGLTQAEAGPLEASANGQAAAANVLFGIGGALGAAGVVLVVLGPSTDPVVALSPAPGGLSVSGRF